MLSAATFLVAEGGAARLTATRVVARSGVSRRTFYEIFKDREECLLEAFEEAVKQATRRVAVDYPAEAPWCERLRAGLFALLDYLEREPATARLLVVESLAAGPRVLERRAHIVRGLAEIVAEGPPARGRADGPSALAAEGAVGAVLSVLHARIVTEEAPRLVELTGELMAIVVQPYLGAAAARREAARATPKRPVKSEPAAHNGHDEDALDGLEMRLTYRTIRVLSALSEHPGASNRYIGDAAEIGDPGQISKLLSRLARLELVKNTAPDGPSRGAPNAWSLTTRGRQLQQSIAAVKEG
jgi:AcrR family transcriptional regulator/DNA-binding MarR family transcriptional regulator